MPWSRAPASLACWACVKGRSCSQQPDSSPGAFSALMGRHRRLRDPQAHLRVTCTSIPHTARSAGRGGMTCPAALGFDCGTTAEGGVRVCETLRTRAPTRCAIHPASYVNQALGWRTVEAGLNAARGALAQAPCVACAPVWIGCIAFPSRSGPLGLGIHHGRSKGRHAAGVEWLCGRAARRVPP
jgi:hypothetical protein